MCDILLHFHDRKCMTFQNPLHCHVSDIKFINISKCRANIKSIVLSFWEQHSSNSFTFFRKLKWVLHKILTDVKNIDFTVQTSWSNYSIPNYQLLNVTLMIDNWTYGLTCLVLRDKYFTIHVSWDDTLTSNDQTDYCTFMKFHTFLTLNRSYIFSCLWIPNFKCAIFWSRYNTFSIWRKICTGDFCSMTRKCSELTIFDIPHPNKSVFWSSNYVVTFAMPVSKVDIILNIVDCSNKFEPLATHENFSSILREL